MCNLRQYWTVNWKRRHTAILIKDLCVRFANLMLSLDLVFVGTTCHRSMVCKPQGAFCTTVISIAFLDWLFSLSDSQDGTKIYGRCGGFCGKCIPNTIIGLQLQIQ